MSLNVSALFGTPAPAPAPTQAPVTVFHLKTKSARPAYPNRTLRAALETQHASDMSMVAYSEGGLGDKGTRYNKKNELPPEGLQCFWMAIDIDLAPGDVKKELKRKGNLWWKVMPRLTDYDAHTVPGWCARYATPNGYRIIYRLSRPLSLMEYEGLALAMAENSGPDADLGCADWTRLMRLPFIKRDEYPNNLQAYEAIGSSLEIIDEAVLDVDGLPFHWEAAEAPSVIAKAHADQFTPELLGSDRDERKALLKHMKRESFPELYDCISEQLPLPEGGRNTAASKGVGSVAWAAVQEGLTAEEAWQHIAIPFAPTDQILLAWNTLQGFIEAEIEKGNQKREANRILRLEDALNPVIDAAGVSVLDKWKKANRVPEHWGQEMMLAHRIIATGVSTRMVMNNEGIYAHLSVPMQSDVLTCAIMQRTAGTAEHPIQRTEMVGTKERQLTGQQLWGHPEYRPQCSAKPVGYVWDGNDGLQLDFTGEDIKFRERFAPLRRGLQPVKSDRVDRFLTASFREDADRVRLWLSMYRDVDSTCLPMLLVFGEGGVGKDFMALTLLSMFTSNGEPLRLRCNGLAEADFQDKFRMAPVLVSSELNDKGPKQTKALNDVLREKITDDSKLINPKGHTEVLVQGYHRFVGFTNHMPVLEAFIGRRAGTEGHSDVASAQRILPTMMYIDGQAEILDILDAPKKCRDAEWQEEFCNHVEWLRTQTESLAEKVPGASLRAGRVLIPTSRVLMEKATDSVRAIDMHGFIKPLVKKLATMAGRKEAAPDYFTDGGSAKFAVAQYHGAWGKREATIKGSDRMIVYTTTAFQEWVGDVELARPGHNTLSTSELRQLQANLSATPPKHTRKKFGMITEAGDVRLTPLAYRADVLNLSLVLRTARDLGGMEMELTAIREWLAPGTDFDDTQDDGAEAAR